MSNNNNNENGNELCSPVTTGGGHGGGGGGGAHAMHRLRQVHVAHGGRIRTSWHAALTATKVQRPGGREGTTGGGSNGKEGGHRSVCGYSWALVRTRGVVGDEACSLACGVIEQGTVSDHSAVNVFHSDHGGAVGSEGEGGGSKAGVVKPSSAGGPGSSSTSSSPWRWQRFDVDTTAWLPGDSLSLWARLDEVQPFPPVPAAGGGWVGGASAALEGAVASARRGGRSRRCLPPCYRPLVRSFELRVVDDARAEEIARGSCALSRDRCHRHVAGGTSSGTRLDDGSATAGTSAARLGDECFYAPAFDAAASGHGRSSVKAVQLDLAAVSPMNMAAAGGDWA